ncbi:tetratricopeptide repeat protein [Ramlibacter tataouinensis]|uniref:tetratricopeptide repeat protein n=1 Tax=Ramlibacter tataouinensis TaxID=94132 RepID=UPI0022F39DFD|nr:tetratricopeptide repeat protein [Ramlibacter tataouinensis]WBY00397.1 tetratricopeptide repeat protein [Ramlibacter tataouinensis]
MDARFEQAKAFFLQGLGHYQAGRFEAAERDFGASLSLLPGRLSTLTNLGATRLKLGRVEEAAQLLQEVLQQEPDNAEALGHLAAALAEMGRREAALDAVRQSLDHAPGSGAGWLLRATLARELGSIEEAAGAYRQALAHGADPELVRFGLAAVQAGDDTPPAPPAAYVQTLFDSYAEGFEEHLAGALGYRAPQVLAAGLGRARYRSALDLGCGTGLCAPLLRARCDRLEGIDLSPRMVEQARGRGLYDEVQPGDLAGFLGSTGRRYDLLLAADVFIYVGALERVFEGAARVLEAGGEFCFSLEDAGDRPGFVLQSSLRYAHGEAYVRALAGPCGFELQAIERGPLRMDAGQPVAGLFAWLRKGGAAGLPARGSAGG